MHRMLTLILLLVLVIGNVGSIGAYANEINFTEQEMEFISAHPVITLGIDPEFVPFEFINSNGEYVGITAEYLDLISEKTGLQFQIVENLTWVDAYERATKGEIDVLPAISKTTEREDLFLFSDPYYYFQRVIVIKDTVVTIKEFEDLDGLTVAVQKNSSHHSDLLNSPNINLSLYQSAEGALAAVARGDARAYVGNLATTNYIIRSRGMTGLKYVAFESNVNLALHLAVRKNWPELVSILNKGLATITEEQKIAINNDWIGLETSFDYGPIIRAVMITAAVVLFIFAISGYWIMKLRMEIEKRKAIETELIRAEHEANVANQIKSSFLARMSHEIRTPLNAITGMAYLMKKTDVSTTQMIYIDKITQASSNMLSIINDILDFSKIEAGKIDIEHISFSLDSVFQNVVNIVSYKIEEQGIGLSLAKDPRIPDHFMGDPTRIEQILLNVVNNAVKFTNEGGVHLDIRLIANEGSKYHVAFTVRDTGIGMSEEQISSLFEPFSQADSSINRRFGGTGLGLSIVKSLVDMLNGEIVVYSKPGEGSTFVIQLPLEVDEENEKAYGLKKASISFKGIRTIVLEKTGSNMNLIDSYLSAFGMDCELTTSPENAVKLMSSSMKMFSKPFDLLILDYDTPNEGGFEFVKSLYENNEIAKMPKIIMMIPLLREDYYDKLEEYDIEAGVGKPIIPSVLYNAILEIFKFRAVDADRPVKTKKGVMERSWQKQYKILVVEDNKTNQFIAKSILEAEGFEVIFADNGAIGVDVYREASDSVDLILMDLHMPVLNGYEAAKQIRTIDEKVPIVAMTADAITGVDEQCKAHGIGHYIPKPFDPEELLKLIGELLSKSSKELNEELILNRSEGMRYLGQNEELYNLVLKEYQNENKDTVSLLNRALEEGDYDEAKQIVHKVKSSSGSIGAKSIYQVSIKLQEAIEKRNLDEVDKLYAEFSKLMTQLLLEIGS